jgi:hypothetical protein
MGNSLCEFSLVVIVPRRRNIAADGNLPVNMPYTIYQFPSPRFLMQHGAYFDLVQTSDNRSYPCRGILSVCP